MKLPRINGEVDSNIVSEMIVGHILAETASIYGTRIDNKIRKDLEQYTKNIIELVKRETTSK